MNPKFSARLSISANSSRFIFCFIIILRGYLELVGLNATEEINKMQKLESKTSDSRSTLVSLMIRLHRGIDGRFFS